MSGHLFFFMSILVLKQYECIVRVLVCMSRDKKYKEFVRPVDPEQVPDYYDVVLEPMCIDMLLERTDDARILHPPCNKCWNLADDLLFIYLFVVCY